MSDHDAAPEAQNTGTEERIVVVSSNPDEDHFNPAEDATTATGTENTDPADPSEPSTDEGNKPPKGVQKRLDELTREKYEARRQAEATQAQLDRALALLERSHGVAPPQEPQHQPDPYGPPDPADYPEGEFDIRFIQDTARHLARQEFMALREQEQHQAKVDSTVNEIRSREAAAREKFADYDDVVKIETLSPIAQYNPMLIPFLAEHESGPELAYYLGKNPEEVIRLAQMHPMQAANRIGFIASQIVSPGDSSSRETPPQRRAPPPITPIKGGGSAPAVSLDAQLAELEAKGDFDGWRKLKRAHKG